MLTDCKITEPSKLELNYACALLSKYELAVLWSDGTYISADWWYVYGWLYEI